HGEPPSPSVPPATRLTLQVAPLWYQTYLFYVLAAVIAVLIPWGAWTLARLSQAARQRQLEALVDERTEALTEALATVERMSLTDSLTGIPNRRHLEERLESMWNSASRQGQNVAALILDIDHFKQYNDSLGHQAGDQCLQCVSSALANHTRGSDFLARYGGEEFVVLMTGVDQESGKIPARRLQASVRNLALPHPALGDDGIVTLSAGFALLPASEDANPETLIRLADDALYEAKRAGRDRVVYHHEMVPDSPSQAAAG
ncbi:MAG: GGDEF domain-containing protein, partial [Pseudomonadota bacterium]